jgi:hypothetical protein
MTPLSSHNKSSRVCSNSLAPLKKVLDNCHSKTAHPRDETSMRDFVSARPKSGRRERPLGPRVPYFFSTDRSLDVAEMISAGPDKALTRRTTFKPRWAGLISSARRMINRVVNSYQRTGGFVRDLQTLTKELLDVGESLNSWRIAGGNRIKWIWSSRYQVQRHGQKHRPNRVLEPWPPGLDDF